MTDILVSKETGNQYKILNKIGEGAYAQVFKGQNIKTKEKVAIKKMKNMKKADTDMAKKEIELMKSLNHKNIVRFIDQFRHNGIWYIILEYCGKGDLQEYKKKVGKIPENYCKAFVRGILEALVELHSERKDKKKIAHRDLKLPNILINDDYQLKLADFGFSKDFEDGWMRSFCGTPLTMAPEVLKRDQYNEKCDVWSLGVISYFLLYNKYPFFPTKSDGPGIEGITNCAIKKPLVFDKTVQISDLGKDFLTKCLQKSLDKRPYSHELLSHQWFDLEGMQRHSQLRENFISQSLEEKPEKQALARCKVMLFGVVEAHIERIFEGMLINQEKLKSNIRLFKNYYSDQDQVLECYLLIAYKKLMNLAKQEIIIILQNRSINVETKSIEKFWEFYNATNRFIESQLKQLAPKRDDSINIERVLTKFLLWQAEVLMDSENQEEICDKLKLFKEMTKTLLQDYENSIVNVKWGEREDLKHQAKHIVEYIINQKDQDIIAGINEALTSQDDLESIWLIEHQLIEKHKDTKSFNSENQAARHLLYVLNAPSNYVAEKPYKTAHYQMKLEEFRLCK